MKRGPDVPTGVVVVAIVAVVAVLGFFLWQATGGRKKIELTADQVQQMNKMMGQRPTVGMGRVQPSAPPGAAPPGAGVKH